MGVETAAAFAALSLYQQEQARKQAKGARADVERQNEAQRKQDAWSNLISVAGGGSPQGYRSESPLPSVPGYDFAGTLLNSANLVTAAQDRAASQETAKAQAERQARLDAQAAADSQSQRDWRSSMIDLQQQKAADAKQAAYDRMAVDETNRVLDFNARQQELASKPPAATPKPTMTQAEAQFFSALPPEEQAAYLRDVRYGKRTSSTTSTPEDFSSDPLIAPFLYKR